MWLSGLHGLPQSVGPLAAGFFLAGLLWYLTMRITADLAARSWKARLDAEIQRRKAAEEAHNIRAGVLTGISHEIRAPLNAIVGFTELALKTPLDSKLREYLSTVRASSEWITHILNDVLEYSRIEAGAVNLRTAHFSLTDCINSALDVIRPQAEARHLTLRRYIDPQIPQILNGDGARIVQVLFNLLENAVKFTTSGGVNISARLEESDSETVALRIVVSDTGIGIPPDKLKSIFDPMLRESDGHDKKSYSSGFGLAISKKIAEMMGGYLEAQSHLGAGSTFALFIKLQKVDNQRLPIRSGPSRRLTVLVAEDDALQRRIATTLLQASGHRVSEACNGEQVVQLFRQQNFDLVLMDLDMPQLNGLEAAKAIRAAEAVGSHAPIYALTAHTADSDRERCLAAGMDGFLSKPIDVDTLLALMSSIGASTPASEASGIQAWSAKQRIEIEPGSVCDPMTGGGRAPK